MLDTETIKNISTFVEITMQVESRLRSKFEEKEERLTEDLEEARAAYIDLDKQVDELEEQIKDLEGQKERQAAKITELMGKEAFEDWFTSVGEKAAIKAVEEVDNARRIAEEKAEMTFKEVFGEEETFS